MSKSFLTYSQQMEQLKNTKLIECSEPEDRLTLIQNGYFNLINGYKLPFTSSTDINGKHIYQKGTTIEHIKSVKEFDDNLRLLLFRYITRVEEEVRTLTGYKFDKINNNGTIEWFRIEAYDTSRNQKLKIAEQISRVMGDIRNSKSLYLEHYQETHKAVPTWILTKVIRLSTFISFLSLSKTSVKKDLCQLYGMLNSKEFPDYKLLIGSLQHLRAIRNSCAHNERVFDIATSRRIKCSYFDTLPPSYTRNQNEDKTIMDFIVYMRYFLNDSSYSALIDELISLLASLKPVISSSAFEYIRGNMGIKEVSHLKILKNTSKIINYANFD